MAFLCVRLGIIKKRRKWHQYDTQKSQPFLWQAFWGNYSSRKMNDWMVYTIYPCVCGVIYSRKTKKVGLFLTNLLILLTHFLIGVGRVGPVVQALALYANGWEPHQILPTVIGLKKKINCDQIYMEGMLVYEWNKPAFVCKEVDVDSSLRHHQKVLKRRTFNMCIDWGSGTLFELYSCIWGVTFVVIELGVFSSWW